MQKLTTKVKKMALQPLVDIKRGKHAPQGDQKKCSYGLTTGYGSLQNS